MSSQLGEAFVPIRATLDKLDGDLAQARGKVEGALGKISSIAGNVLGGVQKFGATALIGLGSLATVATGAAVGMAALAASAEPLIGLQNGFATVTDRIGTSSETMLSALEDASGGLITNRDLMASFNKAAALVSDDFASKLPDAMGLVRRASQATGQDMGFLFDSLVTGVGRVSPMILDNLGIQVALAEVTEHAAEMFGKSAEELSKQEQQAALTEIVMARLNDTYGDIPDVAQPFAKARTMLANLKDDLALKLLPLFQPIIEKVLQLAQEAIPMLTEWLDKLVGEGGLLSEVFQNLVPIFDEVWGFIQGFISGLQEGQDPINAIIDSFLLWTDTGENLSETAFNLVLRIGEIWEQIKAGLEPVVEAITQFVSWKDVLIGLAIAIGTVVIPIIWSILSPILAVVAIGAALIGTIALVRNAWEKDWGGIRTTITTIWDKYASPIFEKIREWLSEKIPVALKTLSDFWTDTLLPAIQKVEEWLRNTLMPFLTNVLFPWIWEKETAALQRLSDFWTNVLQPAIEKVWSWLSTVLIPFLRDEVYPWIKEKLTKALQTLSDFWTNTLLPAIQDVWGFIQNDLVPLLETLWELVEVTGGVALTALQGLWENVLLPAITTVWEFIKDKVLPALSDLWDLIESRLNPVLESGKALFDKVSEAVGGVSGAVQTAIGWIQGLIEKIGSIKLPDFLTPGSPTPFEMGIRGISDALKELNSVSMGMPIFNPRLQPAMGWDGSDDGGMALGQTTYNSDTKIYTNQDPLRVLHAARHLDKLGRS